MKRVVVFALLALALTSAFMTFRKEFTREVIARHAALVNKPETTDDLKETLVTLEKHSWEAWKKRDGTYFQDFLSDDHVEVGFYGTTNKTGVVKGVSSPACVVNTYTVDNFEVTPFSENTALLTYHAAQDTTCGSNRVPSPVWVSSLYVKRNGRWLNALYQQTQDGRQVVN
jgi:hypothetical protein